MALSVLVAATLMLLVRERTASALGPPTTGHSQAEPVS
jgi:hypothetical protein